MTIAYPWQLAANKMHVCIHERLCLCICFLLYYGKPLLYLAPSKLPWSPPRAEPEQSQSKARAKPGRSQGKARAKPEQPGFGKPEQPGFGLLPTQASLPSRVPPLQKLYKHLVFALVAKGDSRTCFGGGCWSGPEWVEMDYGCDWRLGWVLGWR